jgi:putative ABC transport system ATP-binding protein
VSSEPPPDNSIHWTGASVLRRTLTRNLRWLIPGTALISVHQLCEVAVPVLIGIIVDRAVATGSVSAIVEWIAVLAALFVVLTLVYRFGARLLMFAIARESHLLRVELSAKILDPMGIHTDYKVGELLSISSGDAEETGYLIDYLARIAGAIAATIACGALLLSIDLPLGLMVLIGVPIVVAGLQLTAPIIADRVEHQQAEIGRATALATDLISGHRPLQGIGAQRNASARYRVASRRSLTAALRAARIQSVHAGAAAAAGALAAMAVAVAATYFALRGDLSIGQLITVIGLAQFLAEPFALLAVAPSEVAESRGSANRVARVLDSPVRHQSEAALPAPADVDPRGLTVRDAAHASLHGLALDVEPGEFVAVLTPDARDAGAFIDLLSGYVRAADAGAVRVGGRRIGEIPLGERHTCLLVEHHNGDLFSGTLESNLSVSGTADPVAIRAALEGWSTRWSSAAPASLAGNGNAGPWPGRSPPTPTYSSCTTRPPPSTPSPNRRSPTASAGCGATASGRRSCSPAVPRYSPPPIGWYSSAAGASRRRAHTANWPMGTADTARQSPGDERAKNRMT